MVDQQESKRDKRSLNGFIDILGSEMHLPGYRFCGPGTGVEERLAKGEHGINSLDESCRTHDIAYKYLRDDASRREADIELAKSAVKRLSSAEADVDEKKWAYLVALGMAYKANIYPKLESIIPIPRLPPGLGNLFIPFEELTYDYGKALESVKTLKEEMMAAGNILEHLKKLNPEKDEITKETDETKNLEETKLFLHILKLLNKP